MDCDVRIHGDLTECAICGLNWDTNDPCPPQCPYAPLPQDAAPDAAPVIAMFAGLVVLAIGGGAVIKWALGL